MKFSTQTRKYTYWAFSFIALFTILTTSYHTMGGFEEIQTGTFQNEKYSIAGKSISGKFTSKDEYYLFEEVKKLIASGELIGTLTVVNYNDDSTGQRLSRRFVGVLLSDEVALIPSGFKVLEIESDYSFRAALTMHPLVMPNTEKVEAILKIKADSLGISLRNYTMERLFADNSVIVEVFGK